MRLLFLSHCTPNPPDKGEKIRARKTVMLLGAKHEVHVVCFARQPYELDAARELEKHCASVYVEMLHSRNALLGAAVPFLLGGCLNMLFYRSASMARRVAAMAEEKPFDAAIAYTLPMTPYVPAGTPHVIDMQDVDSEKWFQYAERRHPAFLFRMEARRLRKAEVEFARRADCTYLVTEAEERLFRGFAGDAPVSCFENGADLEMYDPALAPHLPELAGRRYIVFVGSMNYYPNAEGAVQFSTRVFPELRRRDPQLELFIVGRSPGREVLALGQQPGITVTGAVDDTRPYLIDALAAIAPLQLARGIQVKVLEALAIGKPVLVSRAIATTFGTSLPLGTLVCDSADDYHRALRRHNEWSPAGIRDGLLARFSWDRNLSALERKLEAIGARR